MLGLISLSILVKYFAFLYWWTPSYSSKFSGNIFFSEILPTFHTSKVNGSSTVSQQHSAAPDTQGAITTCLDIIILFLKLYVI